MSPIYLDYNATTPIDPAVTEAMLALPATALRQSIERARPTARPPMTPSIRHAIKLPLCSGATPKEIVFTGGGTEASNHAIKGAVFAKLRGIFGRLGRGCTCHHQRRRAPGHAAAMRVPQTAWLPGHHRPRRSAGRRRSRRGSRRRSTADTTLVSIMHANNEVGTLQPIREIADLAHERGALMHTDAAQSRRQSAGGRQRAGRRSAHGGGAQAVRPQGRRRALRSPTA